MGLELEFGLREEFWKWGVAMIAHIANVPDATEVYTYPWFKW
jgi:hypothetical protein